MGVEQQTVQKGNEYTIDQQNQWMRSQPWYQQFLQQNGQRPDSVRLSKSQSQQLLRLAQANGMRVDEGSIEVDPAGNFNPIGHKLRNGLIAGGIAGAAIAAPFAIGALSGAAGAGGAATAAGGAAGYGGVAVPSMGVAGGIMPGAAATAAGTAGVGGGAAAAGRSILSRVGSSKFLTGAADVLGGASRSAAQNNALNDANAVNLYNSQEGNQLARDRFALDAPGTRMGQSAKASILSRVKPTTINWGGPGSGVRGQVPTTAGGFHDGLANMDPAVGQLAQEIMQQNLANQRANRDGVTVTPPRIGRSSAGDRLLGGAALGTSILGLLRR
jgi:hypothetical protein